MDWAPLLYQYGIGSILVFVGIYAGYRHQLWSRHRLKFPAIMLFGYVFMFAVQFSLQMLAAQ